MDYLIAPTLFQNKICRLPGIGTLAITTIPAENDFTHAQIKAPVPSIGFTASKDTDERVFNEFSALSELIKKDIDEKGRVTLESVGDFVKNEAGIIEFIPQQVVPFFLPPVQAKIVIRHNTQHAMLVGDKETTNTQMTGYFDETVEPDMPKKRWWIWAIVLGIIGLTMLLFYISQYGFNMLGNAITP